jgi:hypothetical protein
MEKAFPNINLVKKDGMNQFTNICSMFELDNRSGLDRKELGWA